MAELEALRIQSRVSAPSGSAISYGTSGIGRERAQTPYGELSTVAGDLAYLGGVVRDIVVKSPWVKTRDIDIVVADVTADELRSAFEDVTCSPKQIWRSDAEY